MAEARQARGYLGKARLMFETEYRVLPDEPGAYLLPITNEDIDGGRPLNSKDTLTGRRAPGRPYADNMDVSGNITATSNIMASGVLLKALCGSPSTSELNENLLLSGSAVNCGQGFVRLGCVKHGLRPFTEVTISGSVNYDGVYNIQPESGSDDIVIEAVFIAEDFSGTETVRRGAVRHLDGADAVDLGGGLVGIDVAESDYMPGAAITIAGTENYDGTYVLDDSTVPGRIVVSAVYAAESFSGSEKLTPRYFKHVFKLGDEQPSFALEREVPLTGDKDNEAFHAYEGLKVSSLSITSGTSGQLTWGIGVTGATSRLLKKSLAHTTKEYTDKDFENFGGDVRISGEYQGRITSCSISVNTNLDTSNGYVKGSQGTRRSLAEGTPSLSGSITALYADTSLLKKAKNRTEVELSIGFVSGGCTLEYLYPEALLQESGSTPKLSGPQGIVCEYQIQAYQDKNEYDSAFVATLINGIASY